NGMFLWRRCAAYQRLFLKQEQPDGRSRWEPADNCAAPAPPAITFTPASATLAARAKASFSLDASASFQLIPQLGSFQLGPTVAGPREKRPTNNVIYTAPDFVLADQTVTLLATASDKREGWATVNLLQDVRIAPMPSGKKSAHAFERLTLRGGESRRFAISP